MKKSLLKNRKFLRESTGTNFSASFATLEELLRYPSVFSFCNCPPKPLKRLGKQLMTKYTLNK